MATPFLGEIRVVAFDFAPQGWLDCDGRLMSIAQNTALFSLLGTTYGGNGTTNFALPDFRGRVGVHVGQSPGTSIYVQGEEAGTEGSGLTLNQLPAHNHALNASTGNATTNNPTVGLFAKPFITGRFQNLYNDTANAACSANMILPSGSGNAHENRQPYLAMRYVIAVQGIFPSRS